MDLDQIAPLGAVIWVHIVCLYTKIGLKSLQEYSADDINSLLYHLLVILKVIPANNVDPDQGAV